MLVNDRVKAAVWLLAAVLLVGACGGGSSAPAGSNQATGTPIKIGFVNIEKGTFTLPGVGAGVRAAVKHINADLNGIDGHPIVLDECIMDLTPEAASLCTSQMVDDKVQVVIDGFNVINGSMHKVFDSAGITMVGWLDFTPEDDASKNSFFLSIGSSDYNASIALVSSKVLNARKAAFVLDNPTGLTALPFVKAVAAKAGMSLVVTPYADGTTDFATVAAQAAASKPDVIFSFATEQEMPNVIKAVRDVGFKGAFIAGADRAWATSLPTSLSDGIYTESEYYDYDNASAAPASVQPELAAYKDAINKYYPGNLGFFSQGPFSQVMTLYSVLNGLGPDHLTGKEVTAAFQKNIDIHKYMGTTLNCGHPVDPKVPSVCAAGVFFLKFTGGKFTLVNPQVWSGQQFLNS